MQREAVGVLAFVSRVRIWSAIYFAVCLAALAPAMAEGAYIADGGFETPALASDSYLYFPLESPWTFGPGGSESEFGEGGSGVINNSEAWPTPASIDGAQIGFIQSAQGIVGSLRQSVTFDHAGTYELQYYVAGRSGWSDEGGNLPFTISYGGTAITSDASTTGQVFTLRTVQFSAPAGTADLVIQGFAPVPDTNRWHDNTAFFDGISILEVPEPASLAVVAGVVGTVMGGRRRK